MRASRKIESLECWRRPIACLAAFTLIELLVVITLIGILAALLLPSLARAQQNAHRIACVSNMKQIALSFTLYGHDNSERFPDRRDLKTSLPGGYLPWSTWPKSDPRSGWAAVELQTYLPVHRTWKCPSLKSGPVALAPQTSQPFRDGPNPPTTTFWLWRFDHADPIIPLDNFWGKTESQAIQDLRAAGNPVAGNPAGPSQVELISDVYYPNTVPSLPPELRGRSAHSAGRNRMFLDGHLEFLKDFRTRSGS